MKHVYRALIFVAVFLATIVIFSGNITETRVSGMETKESLSEPVFPTMVVKTQGYTINLLHGYNSNLKATLMRESMTPIGMDQEFQLVIDAQEMEVRKLKYELRKVNDNSLMDSGEISVMEETNEGKVATVKLNATVEQGKEYAFKVTAIATDGKKIHYFTRVKYYGSDSFLKEKMDFVMDFHDKTFKKNKVSELAMYLEYSTTNRNDNFAHVDITSSQDMISWGNLKPKVISDVVPTIKEFNIETAAICLNYYVQINSGSGKEVCKVKEFFRVRYSGGRLYLLKYNRDMSTVFDIEHTSISESDFKIGIAENSDVEMAYNEDESRLAFVASGELWYYNLSENKASKVFTFQGEETDYVRAAYDQHDIRIININEGGDIEFFVYGYMNAGDYEGCVGLALYKYYAGEDRIEELVFIPLETTYQILKENLEEFSYVSSGDVFYFSMYNGIYSYDLVAKKLECIAKNLEEDDYCYVEDAGILAWQPKADDSKSKKIAMMDLETKKTSYLSAEKQQRIILIGKIDNNIVYGLAKTADVSEHADGFVVTPMYKVCIVDKEGNLLKEYEENNIYVESATIQDNVIKLNRVKKVGNVYEKAKADSIQNKEAGALPAMGVNVRITEQSLKEYYLYLRAGFNMQTAPDVSKAETTIVKENLIVRLDESETKVPRYYVYAEGVIKAAYEKPSNAINAAEEAMGVVINQDNQIVYERSGKYTNNQIGSLTTITVGNGVDSKAACIGMILRYNHITANLKKLSSNEKSAYTLLKKKMKGKANVVNLKGCTLDEVLYFVSGNRPVIALTGNNTMVLLTEYTESTVSYINPITGKTETKGITQATEMFEAAGNAFVSYVQ